MSIEENKLDREAAFAIFCLILEEKRRDRFWESLLELVDNMVPKAECPPDVPQPELIAAIEGKTFPAGKWAYHLVRDVPTDYICWWVDQNRGQFNQQLAEYVKTRHFREKQDKGL